MPPAKSASTKEKLRAYARVVLVSIFILLSAAFASPHAAQASTTGTVQISSRSDILSDSRPSATSNHTIAFTINNSLDTTGWGGGSGGDATDTITLAFPSSFNLNNIFCKDVDISFGGTATSIAGYNTNRSTQQDCPGSATSWGLFIDPTNAAITFYTPTSVATYVATGTQVTVKIGTNTTFQDSGTARITNPSSAGTYTISVGGTFGGAGNILVSINQGVTVKAVIAESLSLSVSSISALGCTADDGATVNSVSATGPLITFGNVLASVFYQSCQDLKVSTNAAGGYSLTVQENHAMMTGDGSATIPDTTCDSGQCSSVSSGRWVTPTKYGLGHTCLDQTGHDCSPEYSTGTQFRPFPNVAAGTVGVAVDAVGPSSAGTACGVCSSLSWSHTTGGSNRLLTVGVAVGINPGPDTPLSVAVTYNGVAMTSAGKVHTNNGTLGFVQLFYLVNPASGANTVAVTVSGGTPDLEAGSVSFAGVDQTAPVRNITTNFGSGTTPTVTVSSAAGDMVVDVVAVGSAITSSNQTLRWKNNQNTFSGAGNGAQSSAAGAASVTMSYNTANDIWGIIGMDVKAASQSGEVLMSSSTPAIATGRVKYRLSVPPSQAAGTYTNLITYTILGTF